MGKSVMHDGECPIYSVLVVFLFVATKKKQKQEELSK